MAGSIALELTGPAIEIAYREGHLSVKTGSSWLDSDDLAHEKVDIDAGIMISAVLLASSRNGTKISLTLLLPHLDVNQDPTGSPVTGAAIITDDFQHIVGGPGPVLQKYDVRPLSGFVSDGASPPVNSP